MSQPNRFEAPLTPYLTIKGAAAAIDFYKAAFGATELFRGDIGGKIGHASLLLNGALLYLSDDFADDPAQSRDPKALGGSPVTLHLRLPENVDEVWERPSSQARPSSCRSSNRNGATATAFSRIPLATVGRSPSPARHSSSSPANA